MKELVLSNIINFLSLYNIEEVNHFEQALSESSILVSNDSMVENSKNLIWVDLSNSLKFDSISIHLLENISNSLENEDYMSVAKMKKEILNRWEFSTEENFWETGRSYLFDLKKGLSNSKVIRYLLESSKELENLWITEKFEKLDFIIKELEIININIMRHSRDEISNEIITSLHDNTQYTHPLLSIESVISYFKILKENNE